MLVRYGDNTLVSKKCRVADGLVNVLLQNATRTLGVFDGQERPKGIGKVLG